MADNTKIVWADATLNYANGCSLASPGCTNCYAMKQAHRFPVRQRLTQQSKGGMVWTGEVRMNDKALEQALAWKRGQRIFWNAHGDLFHENVPDEAIDRLFAVCALTPQHTHMILTKRSARMREYFARLPERIRLLDCNPGIDFAEFPLPNAWLGVSVEDQQRADERIPDLLATPAAVRFISAEPLLGPVNLEAWLDPEKSCQGCDDGEGFGNRCGRSDIPRDEQCPWTRAVQIQHEHGPYTADGEPASITSEARKLDWVIVGGESGLRARPMHPDWARSLRDQCQAAGVPFLFKQWGEWAPLDHVALTKKLTPATSLMQDGRRVVHGGCPTISELARVGKKAAGRLLDGREWSEFPA